MIRFTEYILLIALFCGAQVIVQSHAASNSRKLLALNSDTTTAVPPLNASNSATSGHTPTGTTSTPAATTTDKQATTKATFDPKPSTLAKPITIAATPTISGSTGYQQDFGQHRFDTTTAAPPYIGPIPTYRQFDPLSFIGGCLLTICLVIVGTMVWKMYIAHVERRYWTL